MKLKNCEVLKFHSKLTKQDDLYKIKGKMRETRYLRHVPLTWVELKCIGLMPAPTEVRLALLLLATLITLGILPGLIGALAVNVASRQRVSYQELALYTTILNRATIKEKKERKKKMRGFLHNFNCSKFTKRFLQQIIQWNKKSCTDMIIIFLAFLGPTKCSIGTIMLAKKKSWDQSVYFSRR